MRVWEGHWVVWWKCYESCAMASPDLNPTGRIGQIFLGKNRIGEVVLGFVVARHPWWKEYWKSLRVQLYIYNLIPKGFLFLCNLQSKLISTPVLFCSVVMVSKLQTCAGCRVLFILKNTFLLMCSGLNICIHSWLGFNSMLKFSNTYWMYRLKLY